MGQWPGWQEVEAGDEDMPGLSEESSMLLPLPVPITLCTPPILAPPHTVKSQNFTSTHTCPWYRQGCSQSVGLRKFPG